MVSWLVNPGCRLSGCLVLRGLDSGCFVAPATERASVDVFFISDEGVSAVMGGSCGS